MNTKCKTSEYYVFTDKRIRWEGHAAQRCSDDNQHSTLVGKLEGMWPLWRQKHRLKDDNDLNK